MTSYQKLIIIPKNKEEKGFLMAQVPADVGCLNEECIAKDDCQRQVIAKNGTAREIQVFGGTAVKKCGKFIQK
ncbi:MAG: hypothetical protein J7J96_04700 [Sulfurimonas sp.]|nr:hypothetical protein [Sulfurimonas sp.]